MGNRGGRFHKADQTLGRRRWASIHWICCETQFKDRHRTVWGESYTELFFLDEVTALAAGHRPCFECRRADARALLGDVRVGDFDRQLHAERRSDRASLPYGDLPTGAMVEHEGAFFAHRADRFLRWTFAGYVEAQTFNAAMHVKVLTPPAILAILARGYQPRWHNSATRWDD